MHTTAMKKAGITFSLAAALTAASVVPAGLIGAAFAATSTPPTPVIVGPLLQILTFSADVGLPTGCQEVTGTAGDGAATLGLAKDIGKYIATINNGCATLQTEADKGIAAGNKDDHPLNKLNPYVNPIIGETAASVTQAGTTYGSSLAPFGPTIAGLGGTINFFQGQPGQ